MDIEAIMERVESSGMPERFRAALNNDLEIIKRAKIPGMCAVILFGSGARGELRGGSDLDLLLVTNEKIDSGIRCEVRSALDEEFRGVRTDLVFYTKEVFNEADSFFIRNVRRDGKILWLQK